MVTQKSKATKQPVDVPDLSAARLGGIAALVSLFSFLLLFSPQRSSCSTATQSPTSTLRAECSIRRLPGLLQLGTVWLPLPHLLMIPFIFFNTLWQNGAGGSIPSMIAYVFGVVGIFRLVRGMLDADARTRNPQQA